MSIVATTSETDMSDSSTSDSSESYPHGNGNTTGLTSDHQAAQDAADDPHEIGLLRGLLRLAPKATMTTLPSLAFFMTWRYLRPRDIPAGIAVAVMVAAVLGGTKLRGRAELRSLGISLIGLSVAVSAVLILGQARAYFAPRLVVHTCWAVLIALSMVVRWPAFGVAVGLLSPSGRRWTWRRDRFRLRTYQIITGLWAGKFSVESGILLMLYVSNRVDALFAVNVVIGLPSTALFALISVVVLRHRHRRALTDAARP